MDKTLSTEMVAIITTFMRDYKFSYRMLHEALDDKVSHNTIYRALRGYPCILAVKEYVELLAVGITRYRERYPNGNPHPERIMCVIALKGVVFDAN